MWKQWLLVVSVQWEIFRGTLVDVWTQVACGTSAVGRDIMNLSHCGQLAACWAAKSLVASKLCRRCAFAASVSDEFVVWRGGGGRVAVKWCQMGCLNDEKQLVSFRLHGFEFQKFNQNMFLYKWVLNALVCNTQQLFVDVIGKMLPPFWASCVLNDAWCVIAWPAFLLTTTMDLLSRTPCWKKIKSRHDPASDEKFQWLEDTGVHQKYLIWRDETMQTYGTFEGIPWNSLLKVHCLGWSYNDPWEN